MAAQAEETIIEQDEPQAPGFTEADFDLGADEESLYDQEDDSFDTDSNDDTVDIKSGDVKEVVEGDDRKAADDAKGEGDESGKASVIDTALIFKAAKLGVSEEKLSAFKDAESLAAALNLLEASGKSEGDASGAVADDQPIEWNELPANLSEDFDESFVGAIKGLNEGIKASVTKLLEAQRAEFTNEFQSMRRQQHQETVANFDDAIAGLGDNWADVLGKGDGVELGKDSVELKNRSKLFDEVMSGKHSGSLRKRVEAAANAVFSDKATKIASDKTVEKVRSRQGKFVSRPSSRKENDASINPMRRALNNVKAKMREYNRGRDDFDTDDI